MSVRRVHHIGWIVWILSTAVLTEAAPLSSKLGQVEFPTSGSGAAQAHFLHGVAALHSFWYEEALEAFRQAAEADPGFAMAYWGQAMAYNHPLWEAQDTAAARKALASLGDTALPTPRERAYIHAVRLLYGEGDKPARDQAYAHAMEQVHHDYPEDLEAACFYSLSLLGLARHADHKLGLQVRAGALALEVLRKNPDHPCAAHYAIHAFDDPDLAPLALPAARRYAKIAPAAHHALHMPSHIFVQLGMWPEAAASNEAAWQSSIEWVKRRGLPLGQRSYHTLLWLQYAYLQQGRYQKADAVFQLKLQDMKQAEGEDRGGVGHYFEKMAAARMIEQEDWDWGAALTAPAGFEPAGYLKGEWAFVKGFAAARLGSAEAARHLDTLKKIRAEGFRENFFNRPEALQIWELEIQAALDLSQKKYDSAISRMKQAAAIEQALPPPSGPPRLFKPTYELLGEVYLRAGEPNEAATQFAESLRRYPNRARSLLGAARAAAAGGGATAAAGWYARLLDVWSQADPSLPELAEAKTFLQKNGRGGR